jgi:predicted GTPase
VIELLMKIGLKVVGSKASSALWDISPNKKRSTLCYLDDLVNYKCILRKWKRYEPHVIRGNVIYAGVDYAAF